MSEKLSKKVAKMVIQEAAKPMVTGKQRGRPRKSLEELICEAEVCRSVKAGPPSNAGLAYFV